jgi:ComF family protein
MCVRPLAGAAICPRCWRDPLEFDSLHCGFVFEGTVRTAIHQLKYRGARHLAEPLALEMLRAIGHIDLPDVVVPVPLHPARFAQRGYNQAALLARIVGETLDASVDESNLRRIRNTAAQVSLSGHERWQNVRGAFEATSERFSGASVLLIDDVATTGSTLRSAASALKLGGARRVNAMVLARAV